jgi:hypothetical protein
MYHAELRSFHATFHSAVDYLAGDGSEDDLNIEILAEDYDAGDYRLFMAIHLRIALNCFASLFIAPPWRAQLARVRARSRSTPRSKRPCRRGELGRGPWRLVSSRTAVPWQQQA